MVASCRKIDENSLGVPSADVLSNVSRIVPDAEQPGLAAVQPRDSEKIQARVGGYSAFGLDIRPAKEAHSSKQES